MIKNYSNLIFIFTLMTGTMISISSNSWLGVWMGLEINLLSFIPLMIDTNNLMSTESSLKYFLTQAFASSYLLFSMLLIMLLSNLPFQFNYSSYTSMFITISLLIKSGVAPFHFWFPNVMEGISWYISLILMTWQKIAPMMILSYFIIFDFLLFFVILSTIIGAIGGLNQTSMRSILAYSSINHMGWMISAMIFNEYLWYFYFLLYSFISVTLIWMLNYFKVFFINQMFSMFNYSIILKFIFLISFLSLSGLPPFLGFLPKWMIIQSLMMIDQVMVIMIMINMALITMYFYLRVTYSAFMMNYTELNWNYFMMNHNMKFSNLLIFLFFTIFGLLISILMIYNFY